MIHIPTRPVIDLSSRRHVRFFEPAYEWDTSLSVSTVTAAGGQVKYSGALIGANTDYTCDLSAITDGQTWYLFVEINLGAGAVALKVQAARPVDDPANSIVRHALSTWSRVGAVYSRVKILHRGAIQFSGIWNQ